MEKNERMALESEREPPHRVTVLRLIFLAWAVAGEELGAYKLALALHLLASGMGYWVEAARIDRTFSASLLSNSFILG